MNIIANYIHLWLEK